MRAQHDQLTSAFSAQVHIDRAATAGRGAALADITDAADIHLWLVAHTERVPGPVAQLLEGLPHDTSELKRLLERTPHLSDEKEDAHALPAGGTPNFPYLDAIGASGDRRRPRGAIVGSMPRAERPRSTTCGIARTGG